MVDPKIVEEWISKADEDFEFASVNLKERRASLHRSVSTFNKLPRNSSKLILSVMNSNSGKYMIFPFF